MLQAIGVEAVVEGLSSFTSGMNLIKTAISNVTPETTILGQAFSALGDIAGGFASFVSDVLAFTLGGLLTAAIQGVVSIMQELIAKTIEAGSEFQRLTLRLNGMNMNDLIQSGTDYNTATTQSIQLTKDQLSWLQKLAATTPYDNTDISNTYALARGYGFTDDEARKLTKTTADFASGMGLTNTQMDRIIVNLGQMKAAGKVTRREMTDLARGAFVPLDDIMGRMAETMGVTTEELNKMISQAGGIDSHFFTDAFEQMVEEEPRFVGAAQRMARTFAAATDNVMDLASSFGGLNIVTPIMNVLGGHVADFMDQFIQSGPAGDAFTDLGERLLHASEGIGRSLSGIVSAVLGLGPGVDDLAGMLVGGLEGLQAWLITNSPAIVATIQGIIKWFEDLGTNEFLLGLIENLGLLWDQLMKVNEATGNPAWWDLLLAIGAVATAIGEVLLGFLDSLGINLGTNVLSVQGLIDGLTLFSQWIIDNQETLTLLVQIFVALVIIQFVASLVLALVGGLLAFIATVLVVTVVIIGVTVWLGVMITIVMLVKNVLLILQIAFIILGAVIATVIVGIVEGFTRMFENIVDTIQKIADAFEKKDWGALGKAIIDGIIKGITSMIGALIDAASAAAGAAMDAIQDAIDGHSPSRVTMGFGVNIMEGLANGIRSSVGLVQGAVADAVGTMSVLAMPSMMAQYTTAAPSAISNTYQSNTTNNLAIHSNAKSEDVAADFGMMQSISGI